MAVVHNRGPKWKLIAELAETELWQGVKGSYEAFMVADDDLIMDTSVVSTSFSIFSHYGLLMAQPSLCALQDVYTSWHIVFQAPNSTLRYTAFIEVMAPIFEAELFTRVVLPSLRDAFTGWGEPRRAALCRAAYRRPVDAHHPRGAASSLCPLALPQALTLCGRLCWGTLGTASRSSTQSAWCTPASRRGARPASTP